MAAPLGNKNAAKAKRWQKAIERALARASNKDVDSGLDKAADMLVAAALTGDQWALKEVGDRMDGKPHQSMDVSYSEQTLEELPDGELLSIARRGSSGAIEAPSGETEPTELH